MYHNQLQEKNYKYRHTTCVCRLTCRFAICTETWAGCDAGLRLWQIQTHHMRLSSYLSVCHLYVRWPRRLTSFTESTTSNTYHSTVKTSTSCMLQSLTMWGVELTHGLYSDPRIRFGLVLARCCIWIQVALLQRKTSFWYLSIQDVQEKRVTE